MEGKTIILTKNRLFSSIAFMYPTVAQASCSLRSFSKSSAVHVVEVTETLQRALRTCSHVCYSIRTKWGKALKSSLTTHAVINQRALSSQLQLAFLIDPPTAGNVRVKTVQREEKRTWMQLLGIHTIAFVHNRHAVQLKNGSSQAWKQKMYDHLTSYCKWTDVTPINIKIQH